MSKFLILHFFCLIKFENKSFIKVFFFFLNDKTLNPFSNQSTVDLKIVDKLSNNLNSLKSQFQNL